MESIRKKIEGIRIDYDGEQFTGSWKLWRNLRKIHSRSRCQGLLEARDQIQIISYLDNQEAVAVHIPQFRSTHQYYKTAKYQLHRTTSDEDTPNLCFRSVCMLGNDSEPIQCCGCVVNLCTTDQNTKFDVSSSPVVRWS